MIYIVCDDYRVECKTEDAAERRLESIENLGACPNVHRIEIKEKDKS